MAVVDRGLRVDARRRRAAFELSQISALTKAVDALSARVDALTIANTMLFRDPAGFTYNGSVTNSTIDGFFVDAANGEIVTAVKGVVQLGSGTCTVTWRRTPSGGSPTTLTGFTASASTTIALVTPTAILLAAGDYIDLVVTSASSATDLRATLFTEHTN